MARYICVTCGTQYEETTAPPEHCPICENDRQYVNPDGQAWTTLEALQQQHRNEFEEVEPGLYRLKPEPKAGIGQYAFLVRTPKGNVLWDCVSLIDAQAVQTIRDLGGIEAIAISHPHFHTAMIEWSQAFGNVPIYIHNSNREWVMRRDPAIRFWEGETLPFLEGITLIRCGGHFDGSAVLHWSAGAGGKGVLLTADTIDIVADTRWVTFMYSFPNLIPLPPSKVRTIVAAVRPFAFDRMYEAFGNVTLTDAKDSVERSAERYIRAISD